MEWCAGVRDEEGVWEGGRAGMGVCARRQRRGWYVCVQGRVRVNECGRGQGRACVHGREREGGSDERVCEGKVE